MKLSQSTLSALAATAALTGSAVAENQVKPAECKKPMARAAAPHGIAAGGGGCVQPEPAKPIRAAQPKEVNLKQLFTIADKNKDGKLDPKEFEEAYRMIIATQQAQVKPKIVPAVPPRGHADNCPACGRG